MTTTHCSSVAASVVSSTMTVNGRFLMLVAMLRKIINDIVLIISFCMSGAVYLFVFSLAKKTIAHLPEKVNACSS